MKEVWFRILCFFGIHKWGDWRPIEWNGASSWAPVYWKSDCQRCGWRRYEISRTEPDY